MTALFESILRGPRTFQLFVLALALWLLARGAGVFVDRGIGIARRLHLPPLIIGLVLVSLATTVPETSVTLMSALAGHDNVAIGNAIGSVICNAGLALGLCAVLSPRPIYVLPSVLRLTGGFLLAASVLILIFVFRDLRLSRLEGLALLALLAIYLYRLVGGGARHRTKTPAFPDVADSEPRGLPRLFMGFGLAVAIVILASRLTLAAAVGLAIGLRIPEAVVALSLLALGTSIPEVATSITAARRGQGEIAIGNILGANVLNLSWVIGMAAVVRPLSMGRLELSFMFPAMFAVVVLTLVLLKTHQVITRREGALLIGVYLVFLAAMWVVLI